jgi:hypothetical protein
MIGLISLLLLGLWLNSVPPLVRRATAPDQRVHSLVQAELPGGVLLIVVLPAYAGRDGEVALWWSGNDEKWVRPLVRVIGTPASLLLPELHPGKVST